MPGLLDAELICRSLDEACRADLERIDVLDAVTSTNTWLMEKEPQECGRYRAVLAEHQTAGRGRQGKRWVSPPRAGVCLSLSCTFDSKPNSLSCLTLAAGIAVARALNSFGLETVKLKWPNDIYAGSAKLGGILTEAQTSSDGRITVIIGVGVNVDTAAAGTADGFANMDYAITDLHSHIDTPVDRSLLAAAIIEQLVHAVRCFEAEGLAPFRAEWIGYDYLKGKRIAVTMPDSHLSGVAQGIDANGALRLMTEQGLRRVYTGSVSVPDEENAHA
ncbi:MAG: biotin--[acetyl-CoA-carboxylase] ligase [Halioglobus sp.]|nr:biotin--[acetyl-CoA-carboxylase] ligase [Halioglobus sp.]